MSAKKQKSFYHDEPIKMVKNDTPRPKKNAKNGEVTFKLLCGSVSAQVEVKSPPVTSSNTALS